MNFDYKELDIPGVYLITPKVYRDDRGYFLEIYKKKSLNKLIGDYDIIQENHSRSMKNVLRGLHFQRPPFEQGKLIRVMRGALMDVFVDLREGSPKYGKYGKIRLDESKEQLLWIPPGLAHGISILEDNTDIVYKITGSEYNPQSEEGIMWNDPDLDIDWNISSPIISEKDKKWPFFENYKTPFKYKNGV